MKQIASSRRCLICEKPQCVVGNCRYSSYAGRPFSSFTKENPDILAIRQNEQKNQSSRYIHVENNKQKKKKKEEKIGEKQNTKTKTIEENSYPDKNE